MSFKVFGFVDYFQIELFVIADALDHPEVVVAMAGHRTQRLPITEEKMVVRLELGPRILVRFQTGDDAPLPSGAVHFALTLRRAGEIDEGRWLHEDRVSTSEPWLNAEGTRGLDLHAVDPEARSLAVRVPGPGTYHIGWRLQRHTPARGAGAAGGMTTGVGTGPRDALEVRVAEDTDTIDVVYEVDGAQLKALQSSMGG